MIFFGANVVITAVEEYALTHGLMIKSADGESARAHREPSRRYDCSRWAVRHDDGARSRLAAVIGGQQGPGKFDGLFAE